MIYFYIRLCHIFLFYTSKEWLDFSNKMREDEARLPGRLISNIRTAISLNCPSGAIFPALL